MSARMALVAKQFLRATIQSKIFILLLMVFYILLLYASITGYKTYRQQKEITTHFQQEARHSWEDNPDKHPHRMAHFGTFAFRVKHPLSMFDYGLENYTGNAVFLEAHKQNTVNFSEAGFSSGLIRFGEISLSMLLQVLLPLIIFFLGFGSVATDKENSTLKVLLTQGLSWRGLLLGKFTGLYITSLLFSIPAFAAALSLLLIAGEKNGDASVWIRLAVLFTSYQVFIAIACMIAVLVSASSSVAKNALLKLLGIWLLFTILLPKTLPALGAYRYPTPTRIAFEAAVEEDILKEGDSHNPNDPHYQSIRDSLLKLYKVDSVEQLPFNYGGYLNQVGERISSEIYRRHLDSLYQVFIQQNNFSVLASFINPVNAIRAGSATLAGSDFFSYRHFQQQTELYRYQLAQTMNKLQTDLISNKRPSDNEKPYSISSRYWSDFPDFHYRYPTLRSVLNESGAGLLGIAWWVILTGLLFLYYSRIPKLF